MNLQKILSLLTLALLCSSVSEAELAPLPVQVRLVLHDPTNPSAAFFIRDDSGRVVPLELRPKDLTDPVKTIAINGSLVLYDKVEVDPQRPDASVAAVCKIPAGAKRGMVVIVLSPNESKLKYQLLFIDDSAKSFPMGESRIITLLPTDVALEAGEHKLPVKTGVITRLPPVRKVSEFNMAQTNFYYKDKESWIAFTERQLQYIDGVRRLFIVHITPGAGQPSVSTVLDNTPIR